MENFAPVIEGAQPAQGSVVTAVGSGTGLISQTFTIMFFDPNPGDDLYVRLIGEYPPYSATSHALQDDIKVPHSVNGETLHSSIPLTVTCFAALARTAQHAITILVSDRPFWDPSDPSAPTNLESVLVQNTPNTLVAQANWLLNMPCVQ